MWSSFKLQRQFNMHAMKYTLLTVLLPWAFIALPLNNKKMAATTQKFFEQKKHAISSLIVKYDESWNRSVWIIFIDL